MAGPIQITLPPGVEMTQEQANKVFGTFLKSRVSSKTRDVAVRAAQKDLIAAHKAEYDKSVEKYLANPPKK